MMQKRQRGFALGQTVKVARLVEVKELTRQVKQNVLLVERAGIRPYLDAFSVKFE